MSQSSAAAVIDLDDFRRRREVRSAPCPAPAAQASLATSPMPVWIVWVPGWYVA